MWSALTCQRFGLGHDRPAHDLLRGRQSRYSQQLLLDLPADHHHRRLACGVSDLQKGGQGSGILGGISHKKAQKSQKSFFPFVAFVPFCG